MRHRMNTIIKLLENENFTEVRNLYESNPKYKKAFNSLIDQKVIQALYSDDSLSSFFLDPGKSATYALSRHDVWGNRILGFIAGVITTIITPSLIGLII